MRRVFFDTGVFYSSTDEDDAHHAAAVEIFERADEERWQIVLSNAIVFETYTLIRSRARDGRTRALAFLDAVVGDDYAIERVRLEDERHAERILRGAFDRPYSYVDALSFAIMERLGIMEAASFDRHFREYGRFTMISRESEAPYVARAAVTCSDPALTEAG